MNISHFFELHIIYILWSLYHKSHYPESHYQHSKRNGTGTAKILFYFIFFFWKNRTSLSNTPRYSFYLFDIHITMIQLLISLKFPTHPFRDIYRCSRQKDVWIFGSTCPLAFWKKSHSENFKKLPCKTSMLESFLSILGSFTNSCSEQL